MLYESLLTSENTFLIILIFLSSTSAFLYSFRFLYGLFLGQEEPEFENVKEASPFMIVPMLLLTAVLLITGTFPGIIFGYISDAMTNLGFENVNWQMSVLTNEWGNNVNLQHISTGVGLVFVFFLAFITLKGYKKTRYVTTKDISSSGELIKPEDNMTFMKDFYKPFERVLSPLLKYKIDKYYTDFANGLDAFFDFLRKIYTGNAQTYAIYVVGFLVILLIFSKSIFGY
jgi:NADH:ubiquinone oxidoreductase subunit 5 (subunit L)/multisubunit Na+/H+ antiporter MnhA subunit